MNPKPTSRTGRRGSLHVLLVLCFAALLSAAPGVASAAPPAVTPFVDCYRINADGTSTVVLGYESTRNNTMKIHHGPNNRLHPDAYQGAQPEVFEPGRHQGVFSLVVAESDLPAFRWDLDRTTLDYASAGSLTECAPPTPLPALGNGTGLAVALVAGGAFGVVFVRRMIRRAAVAG